MSKVTSIDCKNWIIENVHPDTKASDWKRRSKSKNGIGATLRVFENTNTGDSVGVIELDGEIIGAQQEQPRATPKFLYCIVVNNEEPEMGYLLYVEPIAHWNAEHCLTDETDQEAQDFLSKLGIFELMESTFEVLPENLDALKTAIEQDGRFVTQDDFTVFMGGEV